MHRVAGISFADAVTPTQRRAVHLATGDDQLDDAAILRAVNTFAGYSADLLTEFINGFKARTDPLDEKSVGDLKAMQAAVAFRSVTGGAT